MGNAQNANNVDEQIKDVLAQYQILQEVPNENITYLQHKKTQKEYLLREMTFNDKNQYNKAFDQLKKKKDQLDGCQHVTPLVKYMTKSQDQFCSTFYKIYALFQYPQRTLDDQISQRNLQKRCFQQKQLWSILASCILGLSHLQKQGIKHMSLRSSNIMLSHQGIIKISDPYTTGTLSNYDTLLNKRSTPHVYLSPQQADSIQKQLITPNSNPFKSDIWSLGVIMLQAGLLQYQDQCYRDQGSRIHWQTLNYNINRFAQNYSQELRSMIQFMLSKDQRTRPQWIQLQQHVMKVDQGVRGSYVGQDNQHKNSYRPYQSNVHQPIPQQVNRAQRITHPYSQSQAPYQSHSSFSPAQMNNSNQMNYQQLNNSLMNNHSPNFNLGKISSNVVSSNVKQNLNSSPSYLKSNVSNIGSGNTSYMQYNQNLISTPNAVIYTPVKISNIDNTRPTRSFFPQDTYVQNTKIDENLVVVQDPQPVDLLSTNITNTNYPSGRGGQNSNYGNVPRVNNQFNDPSFNNSQRYTSGSNSNYQKTQHYQNEPQFVVQNFKKGSKYEGYKLNGLRHGQGKFYYQDGGMYDGEWNCDKMDGYGKLYYQSGKLAYQGQWVKQKFTGQGILYNQQPQALDKPFNYRNFDQLDQFWTKYQGNFFEDQKQGRGRLYLTNGQYFQGQFKNDLAHGDGIFYTMDGKRISGSWKNNNLV